jgi:hypothetical protein
MRAAVSARVSTTRQAQAQTIEQQLDRLHGGRRARLDTEQPGPDAIVMRTPPGARMGACEPTPRRRLGLLAT